MSDKQAAMTEYYKTRAEYWRDLYNKTNRLAQKLDERVDELTFDLGMATTDLKQAQVERDVAIEFIAHINRGDDFIDYRRKKGERDDTEA